MVKGIFLAAVLFSLTLAVGHPLTSYGQQSSNLDDLSNRVERLKRRRDQINEELVRFQQKEKNQKVPVPVDPNTIKASPEDVQIAWMHVNSQQHAMAEEAGVKYDWLLSLTKDVEKTLERAKTAKNSAVAEVLAKEARHKAELADRLTNLFLGSPITPADVPKPATTMTQPRSSTTGLFDQVKKHRRDADTMAYARDPKFLLEWAREQFNTGQAGAGGVALHKAAEILTPLDAKKIQGAVFEGGRLLLRYDKQSIAFPPLDPEYLALAIRCITGGEGMVEGTLVAEGPDIVVIETGRDQFGQVAWKKEFLPGEWKPVALTTRVGLSIGPGLGILPEVEPSLNRVTYYGPIQGTRMGKTLFEADQLLDVLLQGIDPRTGRIAKLPRIEGLVTLKEREANAALAPSTKKTLATKPVTKPPTDWWESAVWFVLVPDRFSLRQTDNGKRFEFVDTRMKLAAWSATASGVTPEQRQFAEHATEHYRELAQAYPVLKDLEEVVKAVCIARWLKREGIPVDLSWAKSLSVAKKETPVSVRRYWVRTLGSSKKPTIEKEVKR